MKIIIHRICQNFQKEYMWSIDIVLQFFCISILLKVLKYNQVHKKGA